MQPYFCCEQSISPAPFHELLLQSAERQAGVNKTQRQKASRQLHTSCSAISSLLLPTTPRPKPFHRRINPTNPPCKSLQTKRQHLQNTHPLCIQRKTDLPTNALVHHPYNFPSQLRRLDHRTQKRARSLHAREQIRAQLARRDEHSAHVFRTRKSVR
jgi:hypothetical protein